jgi:hypothetical protein
VRTAVENVHEWHGQNVGLLGSGKIGDVSVQRDTLNMVNSIRVYFSTVHTFSAAAALAMAMLTPCHRLEIMFQAFHGSATYENGVCAELCLVLSSVEPTSNKLGYMISGFAMSFDV